MRPPIVDAPELLLELYAYRVILDWRDGLSRPIACDVAHSGLRCRIMLSPGVIPVLLPTDCERDILDVLVGGVRLRQADIIAALARAGKIHGDSTVVKALARMVKDGRLGHEPRRGYAVTVR